MECSGKQKIPLRFIRKTSDLHVGVELLLLVLRAVLLALEGADALEAAREWLFVRVALAQLLRQARPLELLLEPLLEAVTGFVAVLDRVDSHRGEGNGASEWVQVKIVLDLRMPRSPMSPRMPRICGIPQYEACEISFLRNPRYRRQLRHQSGGES